MELVRFGVYVVETSNEVLTYAGTFSPTMVLRQFARDVPSFNPGRDLWTLKSMGH